MSKEEFFKKFELISNNFTENISIHYISDCTSLVGITYRELNKVSCELNRYFLTVFGTDSQYVGVSLSDYCFLPCIILAIWKSGNYLAGVGDQYSKKNILHFLNFLEVRYLITDKKNDDNNNNETLISSFLIHNQTFFIWKRQLPIGKFKRNIFHGICYGIMTSGSTGDPKIIQVPWSCILPNAIELSLKFQVNEFDCIFQTSPFSFDPFFIELLMTLLNGCTLMIVSNSFKLHASNLLKILFDDSEIAFASSNFCSNQDNYFPITLKQVKKKRVTILQITPSCFKRWSPCEIQNCILSSETSLRILVLGGEKFPEEIFDYKDSANTTKIFNVYGITEISCWAFINEVTNFFPGSNVSIGKPLNSIVYKISENGELYIGSSTRVCPVNRESVPQAGQIVFRNTGDVVKFLNEQLYYIGRSDQIIKKFGIKIDLSRMEDLFKYKNKSFKECYCVYDEESLVTGLFFVPVDIKGKGFDCSVLTYEDFYSRNYEIPTDELKDIEKPDFFLEMREIPLNSHGKCDKKKLLQELRNYCVLQKPKLKLNNCFKALWAKALGIKKSDLFSLGFKDLGGTSVLALDIINSLEGAGYCVPQNFINKLLSGKNYSECLRCLNLAAEKHSFQQKRIKVDTSFTDVKLSVRWKFDLGKCVDSTPTVVTFQGEERIVIGSHSSRLSCFKADSGLEVWTIRLGDRIESGFRQTKDGSKGFIGCYDHYVYCISSEDGSIIWKFKTDDMIKSTPCLSTNEKTVYVGSYDKNLYCLSTVDGHAQKSFKLSNGSIFCSGIVSDEFNHFYTGTLDGICVAIDQETNQILWKNLLESPIFANPCLINNKKEILFSEVLGNVHCLNAMDGAKIWTFKADGNIYSSPIVEDLKIFFGCHDSHLYCLQYDKDPKLKWKKQLDSAVFARPTIVLEFSVCAVTTKGVIYLCDSSSGSVKSLFDLKAEVFSSPVYSDHRLFIGCRDNNFYSLNVTKV